MLKTELLHFYTKTVVKTVEDDSIEISFADAKKIDKAYKIDDEVKTEFLPLILVV